ncbi:HEPN domain-containing protein [Roseovarius spongiae]|uniref:HEPN domain-containing protein n=1 Tax=Roseovarius spongiae TaxID=2320272 RepID=UPI0014075CD2|nr:HEPN domain-containing protein [Roseovarius spongiae]
MTDHAPEFHTLKARQRAQRENWPQDFSLRIHRAISWIGRAEKESEDPGAAFLFYWIAFNAAYGGERSVFGARDDFETFFLRLQQLDTEGRLYGIVWSTFPGPIRLFLENRYVFAPFWRYHHCDPEAQNWDERFKQARRRFHDALGRRDTVKVLSMLFDRLYVLRNQLIHGGATWNSGTNRDQLRDGAAILRNVVPVMVDLMMDAPRTDWGVPMYPVIEA